MKPVFVSGCWDLLHPGHVEFLLWASSLGDRLIVSVAADETRRAYKREPVQCETERARMLTALRCVDEAIIAPVNRETPWRDCFPLVERLRPDVWALGPDDARADAKREFAAPLGVVVVQDGRAKPHSTTALIERAAGCRLPTAR